MQKGFFIAIDGQDGTGKTTIINEVATRLKDMNYKVNITKEPTFGPIGTLIRENDFKGYILGDLIAADRLYHIENEIIPALEQGNIVISDRYVASSYVCQQLDGVSLEFIQQINANVISPDISVFILADEMEVLKRMSEREHLARMEKMYSFQETEILYKQAISMYRANGFGEIMELYNNNKSDFENNVQKIVCLIESRMRGF